MADLWLSLREDDRQHSVVRRDKELTGHLSQDWPARRTDARVYNHDMDSSLREIAVGLRDGEGAIGNFEGLHFVCDVDDLSVRLDAQYHSLHGAGEMIGCSEVGGESDEPFWQATNQPDVSAVRRGKSNPERWRQARGL